jgi:hypothetical protein
VIEIIQRREVTYTTIYARYFERTDCEGAGFRFDSDKDGNVDEKKLEPEALDSYRQCLTGTISGRPVVDRRVTSWERKHVQDKIGKCPCGQKVYLSGFTNTCNCGRDYNMSGQELAPRSQWGEETGESVQDILNIDARTPEENLDGSDY